MKRNMLRICLLLTLFLCVTIPAALAYDAHTVHVNGVELNGNTPYWVNGGTTALPTEPVGGYNAYFDRVNNVLILKNAMITRFYSAGAGDCAIITNSSITVQIVGSNTIEYSGTGYATLIGVLVLGDITLEGTGSLKIDLENTGINGISSGMITFDDSVFIDTVSLDIDVQAAARACGISAGRSVTMQNALLSISANSPSNTCGISISDGISMGVFRMISGTAVVEAENGAACALIAGEARLEGGQSMFSAANGAIASYGVGLTSSLKFIGGTHDIMGDTSALFAPDANEDYVENLGTDSIFVSRSFDGTDRTIWRSKADGVLISGASARSPFLYVAYGPGGAKPATAVTSPQTGDTATPRLWIGMMLCSITGLAAVCRKKIRGL